MVITSSSSDFLLSSWNPVLQRFEVFSTHSALREHTRRSCFCLTITMYPFLFLGFCQSSIWESQPSIVGLEFCIGSLLQPVCMVGWFSLSSRLCWEVLLATQHLCPGWELRGFLAACCPQDGSVGCIYPQARPGKPFCFFHFLRYVLSVFSKVRVLVFRGLCGKLCFRVSYCLDQSLRIHSLMSRDLWGSLVLLGWQQHIKSSSLMLQWNHLCVCVHRACRSACMWGSVETWGQWWSL